MSDIAKAVDELVKQAKTLPEGAQRVLARTWRSHAATHTASANGQRTKAAKFQREVKPLRSKEAKEAEERLMTMAEVYTKAAEALEQVE